MELYSANEQPLSDSALRGTALGTVGCLVVPALGSRQFGRGNRWNTYVVANVFHFQCAFSFAFLEGSDLLGPSQGAICLEGD